MPGVDGDSVEERCRVEESVGRVGVAVGECRRRGWAVSHVPGEGFRPCRADEPGAYADLDRYAFWIRSGEAALHGRAHAR